MSCSICLEDIGETEDKHTLDCGHIFHATCLLKWTFHGNGRSCPTCRASTDSVGLGYMTTRVRASYLRRTIARRKNAPADLLRLVKRVRSAEAKAKDASRKYVETRRKYADILKECRKMRSAKWSARRAQHRALRLLGCYSTSLFPLPGLRPVW